ncbi:hypothetical protein KHM19_03520 [Leptospira borgpetersenii]|nr:hypothetical protein KHM09_06170 [Leptospira borgpetersenii]GIM21169.1 hypothetical protein KHM19_03520 [Leptospira borgpetersenii]GIM24427.1 hypothetical protein KHM25_03520 [Leptospira borgpetersenii]
MIEINRNLEKIDVRKNQKKTKNGNSIKNPQRDKNGKKKKRNKKRVQNPTGKNSDPGKAVKFEVKIWIQKISRNPTVCKITKY